MVVWLRPVAPLLVEFYLTLAGRPVPWTGLLRCKIEMPYPPALRPCPSPLPFPPPPPEGGGGQRVEVVGGGRADNRVV